MSVRDPLGARIVPAAGLVARLTGVTAALMAFLAVFGLALSLAAGGLADRWQDALANTATIRLSAPAPQIDAQTGAVLEVLRTTPGVAAARVMEDDEQRRLLEPWFGPDLPLDSLTLPRLIEITEAPGTPFDAMGLRLRLTAEAPGAVLDDHARWRRPLVIAADRLRLLGVISVSLIALGLAGMVTLAAMATLAANAQVIMVLRLVGAKDRYIARAFVRRFTWRAFVGALIGVAAGLAALLVLPDTDTAGAGQFLTDLGFDGLEWALPLLIPPVAAGVAWAATRLAAFRALRELT
ncbi:cell division protein FtsX [Roseicitreum antarcticum]|uniref:Cell division transport system permease protein n=1 Tax=Roseicitreum antarcticum TaxID=564137 RepID=A0A1H3APG3_9RHOB|nr:FtsX-like permease family protein [Roseicitreum antarcticum]SDX30729.1 cell division transport system permease protein [Roseicitreum antarcticum]